MAAVTVTADNDRVDDGEAGTGYSNIGGGASGAAEAPFAYQGSNLFNRKVTSSTGAGFFYDPTADLGTARDMSVSGADYETWMVKVMVSDYGGLQTANGVVMRAGSSGTDYHATTVAGTDAIVAAFNEYRAVGGLLVIPWAVANTSYNDAAKDAGSPTFTAVDYFGAVFAFSASTAKNENCGLDAIDIGTGLYLVGGDGADPDAVWQDFADEDEGTVANRWGYARNADGGGILAYGNWRIGTNDDSTSTATVFNDTTAVITWLDHMANAGFNTVTVDLGSASTTVTDGSLHISAGSTATVDSRADYTVTGTAGTGTFSHNLRNFRNITYTSACTVTGDIECADLTQGGATLTGATIRCNSAVNVAVCDDFTIGDTTDLTVVQAGAGHFVDLGTISSNTTVNWTVTTVGFPNGTAGSPATTTSNGNETIVCSVNSGITLTINVASGASTPSVENNGLGNVDIVAGQVTLTVTVQDINTASKLQNARVYVTADSGGPLAQGTVIIDKALTDANGQASDTRSYASDQPITGRVRLSSSAPYYITAPIAGTISSTGGLNLTVQMVPDE